MFTLVIMFFSFCMGYIMANNAAHASIAIEAEKFSRALLALDEPTKFKVFKELKDKGVF